MHQATLQVCKTFINQYPEGIQQALISLFSPKIQQAFPKLPPSASFKKEKLTEDFLDKIHFSWLAPYLRTLSNTDLPLFLAALSSTQIQGLENLLGYRNSLPKLEPLTQRHLRDRLRRVLAQNQTLIPLPFLPESPFNFLTTLQETLLTKLIHFLGLHDLAFEMRQIIATAILKKIFGALSKEEGEYLNTLLLHREPIILKRLFLEKWDGTSDGLHQLLRERGLHRLAQAIYFAHPSLIWYITHRLDMHMANTLLRYMEKPTHDRAETILVEQIGKILTRITPQGNP